MNFLIVVQANRRFDRVSSPTTGSNTGFWISTQNGEMSRLRYVEARVSTRHDSGTGRNSPGVLSSRLPRALSRGAHERSEYVERFRFAGLIFSPRSEKMSLLLRTNFNHVFYNSCQLRGDVSMRSPPFGSSLSPPRGRRHYRARCS